MQSTIAIDRGFLPSHGSLVVIDGKPIIFQAPVGYHDAGFDNVTRNRARQGETGDKSTLTSRVFTSSYVNTETILHFFILFRITTTWSNFCFSEQIFSNF